MGSMQTSLSRDLVLLFQAVGDALRQNRQLFNQADPINGNHGDHMVEVFEIAAQAAEEQAEANLADAMEHAARLLSARVDNGSAQLYAHGLEQLARQLRRYNVSLDDLLNYVRGALAEAKTPSAIDQPAAGLPEGGASSGDVLKALMNGLAGWAQVENGQSQSDRPLDMGALFEFGMAYMQAKQRGGERVEILADAAASVSPLSKVPHRYLSGKLAIQALLSAMQKISSGPTT